MILEIIDDTLTIEAESTAEAFVLGELWGRNAGHVNMAMKDASTLIIAVKMQTTEPE